MPTDYQPFAEILAEGQDNGVTIAADDTFTLEPARFAGKVTSASYVPEAAATGDNTNARTFTLVNKGQAGAGTTVIATLALTTGVNLVAFDEKAATLSATASDLLVAVGDELAWVSTHTGTGVVDPGGAVVVKGNRAQA
jgi:hypothetical protein